MSLRSYDPTYDVFKGYDLTILENLYNSALNKIVEATETVKSYDCRMPPQGDRTIRGIRSVYGYPTMIVDQM